jgi:hypothetical protein
MAPWVSEKFSAVLSTFQERYKQCKGSKRDELVKEVVKELTALAEKEGVAIPANLEKVLSLNLTIRIGICANFPQESWELVPESSWD